MKKKIFLFLLIIVLAVIGVIAAVQSLFSVNRHFVIKDEQISAVNLNTPDIFYSNDSQSAFDKKMSDMVNYLKDNDLNTVIISFNNLNDAVVQLSSFKNIYSDTEYLQEEDILTKLKKELTGEKIQIYVKINCSYLTVEEITNAVEFINENYVPAGIILEDYTASYEDLQNIKIKDGKSADQWELGLKLTDTQNIETIQSYGAVDFYILSDIDNQQYISLKDNLLSAQKVLLDKNSKSFLGDLFILSNFSSFDGAIFADYSLSNTDLSLFKNIIDTSAQLTSFNFTVDGTFNITYPSEDISTYYEGIYVTGVADANQPAYINGVQINLAQDGTFGVYLELTEGENVITVTQGENSITRKVTKKTYEYTGTETEMQFDDTKKASKGQIVQTVDQLTSVLSDPDNDSAIMDGLQQGVQLVVEESVKTVRSGKYTYAYKLSNGGYVLAKNVQWVDDNDYVKPVVSNGYISSQEDGEYFIIETTGKPGIVTWFEDNTVTLRLLNTDIAENIILDENNTFDLSSVQGIISNAQIAKDGQDVIFTLNADVTSELWGFNVEYTENQVIKVYLKKAPQKQAGAYPLTGISVLLDAGHGGDDTGALAMGGVNGPSEKDLNLAVALATKDCLEKLGATVYLTRSDDTFLTLQERRSLVSEIKPDLFISCHHNSLTYNVDAASVAGSEVYYFSPQSKWFAEIMSEEISDASNRTNRGFKFGYYYVIRNDIAPSILNEYGFMVNPYEYSGLYSDISIYNTAFGTAKAVLDIIPE